MTAQLPLPATLRSRPFSTAEALALGVSEKMLRRVSLASPFAGVRHDGPSPDSTLERCRAASTFLPDGARFSHVTALRLIGTEVPWRLESDKRIHVTVPAGAYYPRWVGLVTHASGLGPLPTVWCSALAVSSPAQTWLQLARELPMDDLVVLADAMTRRKTAATTLEILQSQVATARPGTRGIRALREALALVRPLTDSSMETRARLAIVQAGLPCPEVNRPVLDTFGRFVAMPDLSYPGLKIAIEYDGDIHRTDQATWRRDITRRQAMEALGWRVITCTADDVLRHPARLITWIRAAIHSS
ncbi:endonuclease domain-containing protein [Pengzhenrongella sp.]|uniref:endonuclease domain-containing protein n=1 Tax=Pengzhenrongella sp. TaxID=2888820 RepID=UPI002F947CC8